MRSWRWAAIAVSLSGAAIAGQRGPVRAVPVGDMSNWFSPDNYPKLAMSANRQGRTIVSLKIDINGSVAGCDVLSSSGTDLLDQATCNAAITQGRFNPARDEQGRPIASTYVVPVRWQLPDEPPSSAQYDLKAIPPRQTSVVEMDFSADGVLTACRIIDAKVSEFTSQAALCPATSIGERAAVLLRDGKPVAYKTVTTTSVDLTINE